MSQKCPVCGQLSVSCKFIGDTGTTDHYFTWEHSCSNCDYVEEFHNFHCDGQAGTNETIESLAGQCSGCGNGTQ